MMQIKRRAALSLGLAGFLPAARAASPAVVQALAPDGHLRAAINFGNPVLAQKDPATGAPRGVSVDLAYELGRELGAPVTLIPFNEAGRVFAALKSNAWDVAFLAIDPVRAADIDFTPAYVQIEGAYLVHSDSPLHTVADVDRNGLRIAVAQGSAYDLYLTRALKHATLVRLPNSDDATATFLKDHLDVLAGVKQPLSAYVKTHPGTRLIPGRFMSIDQAMGTPKGRPAGAAFLRSFIEKAKASGFVAQALARSGQGDATVAPAANDAG